MNTSNILTISLDSSKNGGIARFQRTLVDNLHIDHLFFSWKSSKTYIGRILGKQPILFFNPFFLFSKLRKKRIIILNDPQFSTISLAILIYRFFKKDLRIIFISHGFLFHTQDNSFFKNLYFRFLCKFIFPTIELVSISASDSETLKKYSVGQFTEIVHGVNFLNKIGTKKKYNFCFVGRNGPNKKLNLFVDLIKKLSSADPGIRSVLVTSNYSQNLPHNIELKTMLSDEEMINIYAQSKYFVSFSTYEGFGLAALEAVGCGCVPILYANSSFSKIFEKYPQYLFKESGVDSAIHTLSTLDEISYIGLRDFLRSKYSLEAMIHEYKKLLKINSL
jgi:glycosyltransferase involved in cell wall biosynthesis